MDHISRQDIMLMLSVKGYFSTDSLVKMSDEELDNLYIEYIVLAEDYSKLLGTISDGMINHKYDLPKDRKLH